MWADDQWVGLNNVQFCLQQCCAYAEQRLRALRSSTPIRVSFDDCQPRTFQNFSPPVRVADQETHERAFGGIVDREGHDANAGSIESPNDLEELPHPILEENGELTDRRKSRPLIVS